MKTSGELAVQQIDRALKLYRELRPQSRYDDLSDLEDGQYQEATAVMAATLIRLSPKDSPYLRDVNSTPKYMLGALQALRRDYVDGVLATFNDLVRAEVFSDFLEMADHLLEEGYKDPAAVLVGSVLEEHLRALSSAAAIAIERDGRPKKADVLNAELAKAGVYNKLDQKNVTAWLDLRNKAAHGHYGEYTREQVSHQLSGVREFMARNAP